MPAPLPAPRLPSTVGVPAGHGRAAGAGASGAPLTRQTNAACKLRDGIRANDWEEVGGRRYPVLAG
jgi:hypothetical protein